MTLISAQLPPPTLCVFFFFNDTATTEIYTLSLHDALPIFAGPDAEIINADINPEVARRKRLVHIPGQYRSEEHTSELQSQSNLVCRLLLEKKKAHPTASCLRSGPRRTHQLVRVWSDWRRHR